MSLDQLNLSKNDKIRKLLQQHTDDSLLDEIIVYSNTVTKINRKGKKQQRILVITNKAIYNLTDSYQFKRRIALTQVHTISVSSKCNDMVLHVPSEYDYLYRFHQHQTIDTIIRVIHENAIKLEHKVNVLSFELDKLSVIAENEKPKIPKDQSCDQFMLLKISTWQQIYTVHAYKVQSIRRGRLSQRNLLYSVDIYEAIDGKKDDYKADEKGGESDGDDEDKDIRRQWKKGSKLEVYSQSKKEWFKGKVERVYKDDLGEWLVVIYDDGEMEKDLERWHKDLRPYRKKDSIHKGMRYDMLNRMGSYHNDENVSK